MFQQLSLPSASLLLEKLLRKSLSARRHPEGRFFPWDCGHPRAVPAVVPLEQAPRTLNPALFLVRFVPFSPSEPAAGGNPLPQHHPLPTPGPQSHQGCPVSIPSPQPPVSPSCHHPQQITSPQTLGSSSSNLQKAKPPPWATNNLRSCPQGTCAGRTWGKTLSRAGTTSRKVFGSPVHGSSVPAAGSTWGWRQSAARISSVLINSLRLCSLMMLQAMPKPFWRMKIWDPSERQHQELSCAVAQISSKIKHPLKVLSGPKMSQRVTVPILPQHTAPAEAPR